MLHFWTQVCMINLIQYGTTVGWYHSRQRVSLQILGCEFEPQPGYMTFVEIYHKIIYHDKTNKMTCAPSEDFE